MRNAFVFTGFCLFAFTGCTTTPPVELTGVAVSDIALRIKCELAHSILQKRRSFPSGDFQWLEYLTAILDMLLETTEQCTMKRNMNVLATIINGGLSGV